MTKVTDKLGLPRNVLETASMIYRRAIKKGMIKGRSIQTVVAACLYIACRQCRVVRTLEEIAEASNVTRKMEGKVYRYILRRLDVDVPLYTLEGHISKFVNRLGLSGGTERVATVLADLASQLRLTSGRGTSSIAAACVYISSKLNGEGRTQNDVARAADVTEVTIRNRYKEIVKSMNISLQL
jgi:transcription initiation factor TFIIB